MKTLSLPRVAAPALLLVAGLATTAATAQQATLLTRQTNVFGNFLVGAGIVADNGSFSELLTAPAAAYAKQASDGGTVSGVVAGQPVAGSASFASQTGYTFSGTRIVADGAATTTGDTPYAYVSLGANAISSVRLDFRVPVLTSYVLTGSVLASDGPDVGTRLSSAVASVQFSAPGDTSWNTASHQGAFRAEGLLRPGSSYRITANATTRLNGTAQYGLDLVLTPVPEPAPWALLAAGLVLVLRRGTASNLFRPHRGASGGNRAAHTSG